MTFFISFKEPEVDEDWMRCMPIINYIHTEAGCMEVFWEKPPQKSIDLISHYQLFMNKVSYKNVIPAHLDRVYVRGMAGGKTYDTYLKVFAKKKEVLPHESNTLVIFQFKTSN